MSSSRHLTMAVFAALLVVGLGGLLLVWPSYRELAQIDRQTEVLRNKGENYHLQVRSIANLRTELDRTTDQIASELRLSIHCDIHPPRYATSTNRLSASPFSSQRTSTN